MGGGKQHQAFKCVVERKGQAGRGEKKSPTTSLSGNEIGKRSQWKRSKRGIEGSLQSGIFNSEVTESFTSVVTNLNSSLSGMGVQLSCVWLFLTPWTVAHQASMSITNSQSLLKLTSIMRWWCHLTTSSSVVPFSCYFQSFPASGSFPTSQFFASGGQSIGASASASVLPTNIQDLLNLLSPDLL